MIYNRFSQFFTCFSYSSLAYMESSHRSFLSYPGRIVWFFLSGFSRKRNEDDALLLEACKPVDTWFHHLWKLDAFHEPGLNMTETFHLQMCFSFWIYLVLKFACFGSIAIHSRNNSEPTLINVSSMINSDIFFLCVDTILGLYFRIQIQIVTWVRLI